MYLSPTVLKLALWAVLTGALYGGFFYFIDHISEFFTSATILGGIGVVGTALLFSFVHGSFASEMLEFVGLRALRKQGD